MLTGIFFFFFFAASAPYGHSDTEQSKLDKSHYIRNVLASDSVGNVLIQCSGDDEDLNAMRLSYLSFRGKAAVSGISTQHVEGTSLSASV